VPTLPEYEAMLREQLDAMGAAPRAELLRTLMLPDFDRAAAIGDLWASAKTRSLADLLIDAEEDLMVRALLVGMLRERERGERRTQRRPESPTFRPASNSPPKPTLDATGFTWLTSPRKCASE
jgi:hypothetical protein